MAKDNGFHVLKDLYSIDPNYFYGTYFAKPGWLKANEGSAARFLAAITRAHRFMYRTRTRPSRSSRRRRASRRR